MVFADGRVVDLPADRKEAIAMKIWDTITTFFLTPAQASVSNKSGPASQVISRGKGRARRGRKGNDV
jgi:hypothetical protein